MTILTYVGTFSQLKILLMLGLLHESRLFFLERDLLRLILFAALLFDHRGGEINRIIVFGVSEFTQMAVLSRLLPKRSQTVAPCLSDCPLCPPPPSEGFFYCSNMLENHDTRSAIWNRTPCYNESCHPPDFRAKPSLAPPGPPIWWEFGIFIRGLFMCPDPRGVPHDCTSPL